MCVFGVRVLALHTDVVVVVFSYWTGPDTAARGEEAISIVFSQREVRLIRIVSHGPIKVGDGRYPQRMQH